MSANETSWEEMARSILEQEKLLRSRNYPEPIGVIVKWDNISYIGSIQEIIPGFSKEIILLSKSRYILPDKLMSAIRELDKERLELIADNSLDLTGRQHILRRLDNRLMNMTEEQTKYMIEHPPDVLEI